MNISRPLAIKILKYLNDHPDFYFPFLVMCKEYTPEDDDFVEIEPEEWEMIAGDKDYKTFQLWENLQEQYEETVCLMVKGFLEKIANESAVSAKNYIFLTQEGATNSPKGEAIDNLQVLGVARGKNEKDAFKNFITEYEYLLDADFNDVFALELANENQHYFSIKNDI